MRSHHYQATIRWTGNTGEGTASYKSYSRAHEIEFDGKAPLAGSADPAFRGDAGGVNPEEMLVAALSACHMLWFLHLCSQARIVVTAYEDDATGTMDEIEGGGGRFSEIELKPRVQIMTDADEDAVTSLHEKAHKLCFIANSVNFDVKVTPAKLAFEN